MRIFNRKGVHTKDELMRLFGVVELPKQDTSIMVHRDENQTLKIMICFRRNMTTGAYERVYNSNSKPLYDVWFFAEPYKG